MTGRWKIWYVYATSSAVSPDGKHVYAAGTADRGIAVFGREARAQNADYGKLTWLQVRKDEVDGVDGLAGVAALAISSGDIERWERRNLSSSSMLRITWF